MEVDLPGIALRRVDRACRVVLVAVQPVNLLADQIAAGVEGCDLAAQRVVHLYFITCAISFYIIDRKMILSQFSLDSALSPYKDNHK